MKYANVKVSKRESEILLQIFCDYTEIKRRETNYDNPLSGAAKELSTTTVVLDSIRSKLWGALADTHPEDGSYK